MNGKLIEACQNGNAQKVKSLVDAGANVNHADINGMTVLMHACANGNCACAQILVEANANVNTAIVTTDEDYDGMTALMFAAQHPNGEPCIGTLMKAGADIHAKDVLGVDADQRALLVNLVGNRFALAADYS